MIKRIFFLIVGLSLSAFSIADEHNTALVTLNVTSNLIEPAEFKVTLPPSYGKKNK